MRLAAGPFACKQHDGDGDPATTGDQVPLQNWPLTLEIDGDPQDPVLTTGPFGCATWSDLAPAHSYAVEEGLQEGWTALTSTRHDFGTLAAGTTITHTFVNAQQDTGHHVYLPLVIRRAP